MSALLIVDDEPAVLGALEFLFRGQNYEVLTADDPQAALRLLQSRTQDPVGVVISDYRMPGMTGIEFLHEVSQISPASIRILLTAKSDMVTAVDAVNEGGLYRFLGKPCEHDVLLHTVQDAFSLYNSARENRQLNEELRQANEELRELSSNLEARVEHATRELREAIYFDRLTGLPSKDLMQDRLDYAIRLAKRGNHTVSIIHVGPGNFRYVNENLGHQAGNELLCMLAQRLEGFIWEGDSVGRMHGDQFCLIVNNVEAHERLNAAVPRLLELLTKPFNCEGREIYLKVSLGISVYPGDGDVPHTLFHHAETAMHQAKHDPNTQFRFYSEELNQSSSERFLLHSEIRQALQRAEFRVFYQPRISVRDNRVIGFEALIRWQHPQRGLLPPSEFLPMLEETGLICKAGEWVLNTVCDSVVKWQRFSKAPLHVAVNVSPIQLRDENFLQMVRAAIARSGLDLRRTTLELEITENILLDNIEEVRQRLHALKDMGIKIAIDDFGKGYSSLSYLTTLPIHYLKIDRAFVIDVAQCRDAKAIVQAITSLASSLRMQVVAEGIETHDQLSIMRALNCQEFQGFLFSKPIPEHEIENILKSWAIADRVAENSIQPLFQPV
ncbi:MAG TPA: EAL domain-containing protein [Gammaproteobacteria bacterium]